jgi:GNAT superfamily N-acetyltransferase
MIEYRQAVEADFEQLAELRWDFRAEHKPEEQEMPREEFLTLCEDFYRQAFASGRWAGWVAVEDGIILSQFFIERVDRVPTPRRPRGHIGYVTNVYTRPQRRCQGIGGELARRAIAWAKAEGLDRLFLWPSQRSPAFYERAGFRMDSREMELEL